MFCNAKSFDFPLFSFIFILLLSGFCLQRFCHFPSVCFHSNCVVMWAEKVWFFQFANNRRIQNQPLFKSSLFSLFFLRLRLNWHMSVEIMKRNSMKRAFKTCVWDVKECRRFFQPFQNFLLFATQLKAPSMTAVTKKYAKL